MKLKKGDKVKIIQRKSGNVTGSQKFDKPNGDVGSIGFITEINRDSSYCVEDGTKYYGYFDKDDLELLTDEFILPEKWCVKVGDPATKSVFDKWRRSNTTYSGYSGSVGYLSQDGFFSSQKLSTEITYDQFKTHVLKETMEPKQLDLTGRYLKYIGSSTKDPEYGDYFRIDSMNENGLFRLKDKTSGCHWTPEDVINGSCKSFELMPEGFDPNKPTFEVGKWYKNLGRFSDHIGKLCGEVSEDRFPCKEYISDEIYTDSGNFFGHFKNAVLLTDLSEIQQYLPDGHVDKVQATPEYVKCTVTWMNDHTLGTIYKVYKDGYVENDNKEKSNLTWNGGGFEKPTKEAYDAQQDPNVFKAGTYIVLLASCDGKDCWKSSMPINHCYILKRDSHSLDIHIELDKLGSTNNGWSCGSYYDSKMKIRAATPEEIAEYDRLGKPYDVTTLGKVKGEVDMKDIQRQCKEKYPIGSVVVQEKPTEKYIPKVGDWVITKGYTDNYDGKPLKINKINGGIFCFFDEVNFYDDYDKRHNFHIDKAIRKAEPHEIPKIIPKNEHLPMTEPYKYTPEEALAELKRRGFKKGVKYVYMYENGTYDEADIRTASYDPCISGTQYIDCGGGYLWSKENPSHLHRGPVSESINRLEGVDFKLNICDEIPLPVPQVSLWGEPASSTPNYLDPSSLLKKVQLPI